MSTCKLCTFFFIWCFVAIKTSADISLAKTLQSQERFKGTQIYFDHESEKDGALHYMLCYRSPQNMSCTIFKEEHYAYKWPRISPCNVTLKVEAPYVRIGEEVRILPLSPTKALILWVGIGATGSGPFEFGESSSLRNTIVDFETCKNVDTVMKTSFKPPIESFDVLHYPVGEFIVKTAGFAFYDTECAISFHDWRCGIGFCKIRINRYTGKVISDTDFWYPQGPETTDILPQDPRNPNGENFFIDQKEGVIYTLKKGQGLSPFPSATYNESWQNFRYSVRDHFITVCKETEETKVKCDRIDFSGKIIKQRKFDLQKKNVAPVPYTLTGGGLLLLTTECVSNCTENATNHVYKVDSDGKLRKLTDIQGFNCNINKFTHWYKFFEDFMGNPCVSMLCYDSRRSKNGYSRAIYPDFYLQYPQFNTPEELHIQCLNILDIYN